jgi:hypothetical protein
VKQLIAASISDVTFNRIKVHAHLKEMWEELKKIHEAKTALIIMDLQGKMASMRCGEGNNVHTHF